MAKKKVKKSNACKYGEFTTWKKVLKRLDDGNGRYKAGKLNHPNELPECRELWTGKQEPWCIVLSCADSRVTPELVFDTGIGELFVIRVAGNIANASSIASIEYAAANLKTVKGIIVLGHECCGAVGAALSIQQSGNAAPSPALQHLVGHITPALQRNPPARTKWLATCELTRVWRRKTSWLDQRSFRTHVCRLCLPTIV